MESISGKDLSDTWFGILVRLCCGKSDVQTFAPNLYSRYLIALSDTIEINELIDNDFFRFSDFNEKYKLTQLRKDYFNQRTAEQFKVIIDNFPSLTPRSSRGVIYFGVPAYSTHERLKCLDSLYIVKQSRWKYNLIVIIRNSEIFPKLYMDMKFIKNEISDRIKSFYPESECFRADFVIINAFIRDFNAPLISLFLKKWGISDFNEEFKKLIQLFVTKFPKIKLDKIKMQSIKRRIQMTYNILEREGVKFDDLL
ncbi:MAG: hypothetical protein FK733_00075 [Asgard group archaeon]|nr:hypothetical protein [Asgard group archaeon]